MMRVLFSAGQDKHYDHRTPCTSIMQPGGLDSEAEIITVLNTPNGKINSILAALEAVKLTAAS
jgi:hypothetical protein